MGPANIPQPEGHQAGPPVLIHTPGAAQKARGKGDTSRGFPFCLLGTHPQLQQKTILGAVGAQRCLPCLPSVPTGSLERGEQPGWSPDTLTAHRPAQCPGAGTAFLAVPRGRICSSKPCKPLLIPPVLGTLPFQHLCPRAPLSSAQGRSFPQLARTQIPFGEPWGHSEPSQVWAGSSSYFL